MINKLPFNLSSNRALSSTHDNFSAAQVIQVDKPEPFEGETQSNCYLSFSFDNAG